MRRILLLPASLFLLLFAALLPHRAAAQDASVPAEGLPWKPFEEAVSLAQQQNKKVLVDIFAPWCPWCRRLQREVYTDPAVQQYLKEKFIVTRINGDDTTASYAFKTYKLTPAELAAGLGAQGYPTTVFLAANSDYITRLPGFVDASEFIHVLRFIGTEAYEKLTYQEYVAQQQEKE
jgi:thioredoxin-related protein